MVVQHNMQAANANRMLGITVNSQQKSTEKLSSGYRINRAADDAAGLAISEKMRSQIRGLDRASTNAQDGISVVQTAEGALNEVHDMLQRMNELATQAANDTNTSKDRSQIQLEINQLTSEIDRVASTTQFNTMNLLDGSFSNKNLQVGSLSGQKIELNIDAMNAEGIGVSRVVTATSAVAATTAGTATVKKGTLTPADLAVDDTVKNGTYTYDKQKSQWLNADGKAEDGIKKKSDTAKDPADGDVIKITGHKEKVAVGDKVVVSENDGVEKADTNTPAGLSVMSYEDAGKAMDSYQTAIDKVSTQRANLGAVQNRLEHTIKNLDTTSENTQSAESRIRDTDMAKEMVTWSKNNILAQAGQSMLAQANQSNQGVLSLLQ